MTKFQNLLNFNKKYNLQIILINKRKKNAKTAKNFIIATNCNCYTKIYKHLDFDVIKLL